ncbi:MAG: hypothetical protein IJB07_02350 [Firmicutes bacterium]|nr:hypothetical protein [Bacillota bacterium]
MYQIGDQVVYGIHGVCRITAEEQRTVDRKTVVYLVLEPLGQAGTRYLVPTHNEIAMKKLQPMLTPEDLEALIHSERVRTDCWNKDENARKRCYRELISSGDRDSLMRMVYTLYRHKKTQTEAGKRVHLADENFLRDAERLLIGEISAIKGISPEAAKLYFRNNLKEK